MKVKIGPYRDWIGPYQIADAIFFWVDRRGIFADEPKIYKRWDYKAAEKFGEILASWAWLVKLCNWVESKKKRKIKIKIDSYDTWSMDHTLALIIHPMLIQLKNTKHGSPFVDDEDVPIHLQSTSAPPKKNDWDTDDLHHDRWDWVLDEIIWAFEQTVDDKAEDQFHSGKIDLVWKKVDNIKNSTEEDCFYEMEKGPNDTHTFDYDGYKKWCDRKTNGFRLFGKYYQALWD